MEERGKGRRWEFVEWRAGCLGPGGSEPAEPICQAYHCSALQVCFVRAPLPGEASAVSRRRLDCMPRRVGAPQSKNWNGEYDRKTPALTCEQREVGEALHCAQ